MIQYAWVTEEGACVMGCGEWRAGAWPWLEHAGECCSHSLCLWNVTCRRRVLKYRSGVGYFRSKTVMATGLYEVSRLGKRVSE